MLLEGNDIAAFALEKLELVIRRVDETSENH